MCNFRGHAAVHGDRSCTTFWGHGVVEGKAGLMIETKQTLRSWHSDESTTKYRVTPVLAETVVFVVSAYVRPRMVQFLLVGLT